MKLNNWVILLIMGFHVLTLQVFAQNSLWLKSYKLRYDKPAPDLPIQSMDSLNLNSLVEATPIDPAWENWSLPIGNGYLGASIFGRTITERVQLTENSMATRSLYGGVGLTSFGELYIDFNHHNPINYSRDLHLNKATSNVQYVQDGVTYKRTYFASYPDKVLVIKLTASQKGKLSFTIRPEIPYQKPFGAASNNNGRLGKVVAKDDRITLTGKLEFLNLLFEGQFKVILNGGTMQAHNDSAGGKLIVSNADSAIILVAVGTNYSLDSHIFTEHTPAKKLTDTSSPHKKVTAYIQQAAAKKYDELLANHISDYTQLFNRAQVNLGAKESPLPTDVLLGNYKAGIIDHYLEELYFQYGRYLLICSSRPGTLPPNLQGIWSQYDITPWTGGYWHNINIQMNYWPVFVTNLTELFQSFVDYNQAYRKAAEKVATNYIAKNNPSKLGVNDLDNGWTIGTGASAYNISGPGGHSGPGTGALTTKMFWDYYDFTKDKNILKTKTYPALLGMSKFLSKVVIDTLGYLLASPSYSPEQRSRITKLHYKTVGCAFDQQMIYENHNDVLKAAKELGEKESSLSYLKDQLPQLDPVQVGYSGQIKEYREEDFYGELVDPKHRHTSQLVGLYPGSFINSNTPAWLDAAKVSLEQRGDKATGWGVAHRLNLWARIKDGDRAYALLQNLLQNCTLHNLWDTHPPFQIDGNFGATAGIAEMLLQSHEGFIHLLPALPQAWDSGSFSGLKARGNFDIALKWYKGHAQTINILSNSGGICKIKYPNIGEAILKNSVSGKSVKVSRQRDFLIFNTEKGSKYSISAIPSAAKVLNPSRLIATKQTGETFSLQWQKSDDAVAYNIYTHVGHSPTYKRVMSKVVNNSSLCTVTSLNSFKHGIIKITAVDKSGRESSGIKILVSFN